MKIKEDVYEIIKRGEISECGVNYFLPDIKLDRKLYTDTNKVLESLGFKWNRKSKYHINKENVYDKFQNLVETGEWLDVKKEFQFFPTPLKLVDKLIDMVEWKEDIKVLEPSFGSGNILFKIPDMKLSVYGIELNPHMIIDVEKTIPNNSNSYSILGSDFLGYENSILYDVIIMNPPFTKNQDIKHFLHAYDMLSDNGQIICILSSGSISNSRKINNDFNKFLSDNNAEIIKLDKGEFKESGTMVSSIIIKICK